MKAVLLVCFIFLNLMIFAQDAKTDIAKNTTSKDRKEMLEALKKKVQPDLKMLPKLVVKHLYVKGGFAFFEGAVKNSEGKDIDWSKTVFKEANDEGAFDGESTTALLKKTGGKWKVLTYAIGPTDLPWGCWWKEYKAPKEIFSYAEADCSWTESK